MFGSGWVLDWIPKLESGGWPGTRHRLGNTPFSADNPHQLHGCHRPLVPSTLAAPQVPPHRRTQTPRKRLAPRHASPTETSDSPRPSVGMQKKRTDQSSGLPYRYSKKVCYGPKAGLQAARMRRIGGVLRCETLVQISGCASRERQPLPAALVNPERGQRTVLRGLRAATATQGNLSLPIDSAMITRRAIFKRLQTELAGHRYIV